jgi:hypothetical protein
MNIYLFLILSTVLCINLFNVYCLIVNEERQLIQYNQSTIREERQLIQNQVHYDDLALKKCKNSNDWSIHGWWPEYSKGKWPQFCDKNRYHEFNATAISSIRDKLDKYWYSCPEWSINEYTLWQHEWQKHGTCILDVSVVDYFNHTINALLKAQSSNYYKCCGSGGTQQCLIPFAMPLNETKWLGYCYS